ncbi:ISNCY family transposase [Leptospirillum ferrooxidans]|uniref:Putative transposase n=1 Tax=Leptospirillum ferrooxidans (strain C2-3) TaxID=1162668 RepID=I0IRP3_LEPFC|nr:ISNCY family transposase [Leptospirillum ferrooxidans]BAM07942.1 putative transposase [Leptospirillum ferrooxidans C2-3]
MNRTNVLQEIRKMRFEDTWNEWKKGCLTQEEAGRILGMSERTFRRYVRRVEEEGIQGILDKRLTQASSRRAPVDEALGLVEKYRSRHDGWNVKHFHSWYRKEGGKRSYTWVKKTLQENGAVQKAPGKGKHRKRRERAAWEGMMIHQDASRHPWVSGQVWDLVVVTMDDATNEHYSMFFVAEEGTASSLQGIREVIGKKGLPSSLYTDRGSHYWITPEAGGKVDKKNLTQFGRAMKQLGIEMIAAYSPEARGRSERAFRTHQERLPKELALAGITTMEEANRYLSEIYLPAFNTEFSHRAPEEGSAFVPWTGESLDEILCEHYERTVGNDNCVSFEGRILQIPSDRYRLHYVRTTVRVHRHPDGSLSLFHGPRKLSDYPFKKPEHPKTKKEPRTKAPSTGIRPVEALV